MSKLANRLIGESGKGGTPEKETRTYKITCRSDHLDKLEHMFRWMNMTAGGHSGSMELGIDGDGSARVSVEKEGGELCKPEEEFKQKSTGGPEFKVYLETLNTPKKIIETFKLQPIWMCPHCSKEILEHHTYTEGDPLGEHVEFHSDCKGALTRPPYDWTGIDPKWRALIEPHIEEARTLDSWRKEEKKLRALHTQQTNEEKWTQAQTTRTKLISVLNKIKELEG